MPAEYIPPIAHQAIALKQLAKPMIPNTPDPFWIYKAGEQPRRVHSVDFPAWAAQGWSKEPQPEVSQSSQEVPPEPELTEQSEPSAYAVRKAELDALLRQPQGWQKIKAIAEPLGIAKPVGGWDDSIPLILEKEGLAE